MAQSLNIAHGPRLIMQESFDRFHEIVTADDSIIFEGTQLQDVKNAARRLDHALSERQQNPNTARLRYLFDALERYADVAADLCRDTPFLSWIWAPVRLMLEITEEHVPAVGHLLSAYKRIALAMPRFDGLSPAFRSSVEFQHILAILFADIIDFHRRMYICLKKPGWKAFFASFWNKFERRFQCMLDDLARHTQLSCREAGKHDVEEARVLREQKFEEMNEYETTQDNAELENIQFWLAASNLDQEDKLDDLQTHCHEDTCNWIYENAKVKSWIRQGCDHSVLWLKGKPGSGKSVLCSKLVEKYSNSHHGAMLYFFCTDAVPESKQCHSLLRSLVRQLVQRDRSLCGYIQRQYLNKGFRSSLKQLREVLHALIISSGSIRIIIDGLDECSDKEQKSMLTESLALTTLEGTIGSCKVLVSSQDTISISRSLSGRSVIDLSAERISVQLAISTFVRAKIAQSPLFNDIENADQDSLKRAEQTLVNKADGMFLWVQLVISMLENAYSPQEMQQALDDLPEGLDKVYDKIMLKIQEQTAASNTDRASRIFQWLVCSRRPLKKYEVQDAVTFCPSNTKITEETRVKEHVFELCKPLVEIGPSDVIRFVHISVKEYLSKRHSLFDLSTAQFHTIFSCLSYLDLGMTLIDEDYDNESRLVEVGKGFHGLCHYASRYWVEHLLSYITLDSESSAGSKESVLNMANNLAQSLLNLQGEKSCSSGLKRSEKIEKQGRLDPRVKHLEGHEPLYSMVLWTLDLQLHNKIAPKSEEKKDTVQHPIFMMRQKYELLVTEVLEATSIPGLNTTLHAKFKRIYSASILACRFTDCPRGTAGFATAQERDTHEDTHKQAYQCPYPECSMHRMGLSNARRLQLHLEQYHPAPKKDTEIPPIRPFGEYRVATDATLVNVSMDAENPKADHDDDTGDGNNHDDSGKEEEDEDVYLRKIDGNISSFAETDSFALSSTQWA